METMQHGLFCILSHLIQQELPLFEKKKSASPGFTYPIEGLGREKKILLFLRQKEWNKPFGCAMGLLE